MFLDKKKPCLKFGLIFQGSGPRVIRNKNLTWMLHTQQFSLFSVVVMCISLHLTIPVLQMQTLFQLSEGDYLRVYQL